MKSKQKKYSVKLIAESIHTGLLLKSFFSARRIHKSALARALDRRVETLARYQKNSTIQVAILWEISNVLKHNFFADIASLLPEDFTSNAPVHTEQADKISAMEEHIKLLTAERDVLLKAMGGKA